MYCWNYNYLNLLFFIGDARADSPGYSVKYSTYTLMDCDTNHVVISCIVQLGQELATSVGIEKVSFQSCLDELLEYGVLVTCVTTDRAPSIISLMKVKYSHIDHQHDLWHIAKSIKKALLGAIRKNKFEEFVLLSSWIRSITNHL